MKIRTQIRKTYFLAPKLGVDLYTGSTYTRVNTVIKYTNYVLFILFDFALFNKCGAGRPQQHKQLL